MKTSVSEIAASVYRIATYVDDFGIQFNQFLVTDEEPFLMHTGFRKLFDVTRQAVASVLDPSRLRWIGFSHFEADECGALNAWLATAPHAQALCGVVGATVNMSDFAERPARALSDGEVVPIGRSRLRYLATPHVPHGWDAGLFFEETHRTLLCSDLFFQPGEPGPLGGAEVVEAASAAIVAGQQGPLAKDMPYTPDTDATLERLANLKPLTLAAMHGASFSGDGEWALRELAGVIRRTLGPRQA